MKDFNMANLFGKFTEMQEKMQQAQESLKEIVVEAEAGGGMVQVKANGAKEVLKITVDRDAVDLNDMELTEDLIVAAVNKALLKAEEAAREKMQQVSKDLMPGGGLPGFDLSKFGL